MLKTLLMKVYSARVRRGVVVEGWWGLFDGVSHRVTRLWLGAWLCGEDFVNLQL